MTKINDKNKLLLSIIVPCYNESEVLPIFFNELTKFISDIYFSDELINYEIIFVDDGSIDNTCNVIKCIAGKNNNVHFIQFSRNFGKEAAMLAGMQKARGQYIAIMDVDLQDPPELIPQMLDALTREDYDCVCTRRKTRTGEPVIRSFFSYCFYFVLSKLTKTNVLSGTRDFRLMNRKYLDSLLTLKEYNRFSKSLFPWIGFKIKTIEFENVHRAAGKTKWSLFSLFKYSINGIIAFSTIPLKIVSFLGFIILLISITITVWIVINYYLHGDPVIGRPTYSALLLMCTGLIMSSLGVVGIYIAQIYEEIKQRPHYIVKEEE
jgi:glycosyltransferase involved in cell wall biosynthesis